MNNITEIKEEKEVLLSNLKETSIAKKKSIFFASHYSYLNKKGKQILLLVSTFILGLILSVFIKYVGFFLPYIIWIVYDRNRMEELVKTHNAPLIKRIKEIDEILSNHLKLKEALGHTIKFLGRFNKKAS
jgi:hypothetical protein